jgi:hypothetical protein
MADPLNPQNLTPKTPPVPQPYGTASVQDRVTDIASKDSAMNQMARTEAAKVMNRRGMLNTSMTEGAKMDAVLRAAVPIASQEAGQAFQGSESALERGSREKMQLTDVLAQKDRAREEIVARKELSALDRQAQKEMQQKSLTAAEQSQIRDIKSKEGQAAADRLQAQLLQQKDINFRTTQNALDRATHEKIKNLDIATQEKLASWDLKSSDRNAAAQFLTNMETMYQSAYQSINNNPNLDAKQRTAQLTAAKQMRDRQINFVEQMYSIDLKW